MSRVTASASFACAATRARPASPRDAAASSAPTVKSGSCASNAFSNAALPGAPQLRAPLLEERRRRVQRDVPHRGVAVDQRREQPRECASPEFFFESEEMAAARTRALGSESRASARGSLEEVPSCFPRYSSDSAAPRRCSSVPATISRSAAPRAFSGARGASRRVRATRAVCPLQPFRSRFSSRTARDSGASGSAPRRRSAATATPGRASFAPDDRDGAGASSQLRKIRRRDSS